MNPFGLKIISSVHALKETDERLFPVSRNRSMRIHKKLVKRFGGEFKKVPAVFQTPDALICHPMMYGQLKNSFEATRQSPNKDSLFYDDRQQWVGAAQVNRRPEADL